MGVVVLAQLSCGSLDLLGIGYVKKKRESGSAWATKIIKASVNDRMRMMTILTDLACLKQRDKLLLIHD
jgi:hypothetical protein